MDWHGPHHLPAHRSTWRRRAWSTATWLVIAAAAVALVWCVRRFPLSIGAR